MNKLFFVIIVVSFLSCNSNKNETVNIAVANNMRYAMKEIAFEFEKKHHVKAQISSTSSGVLTTQIRQGAPFDIFISANMKYPNILFEENLAVAPPKVYAYGSLVLWTLKGVEITGGLKSLLQNEINKVAIANPETAPYGIAAVQALKNAKLYESVSSKIIWGEGVGQINQYIQSESVDAGITSKSVLSSPKIKNKGRSIEVDKTLYERISQGLVLLKTGKNRKNATLFYNFMFSDEAKIILTKFGYEVK